MEPLNDGPMCTRPMIEDPTEVYRVVNDGDCVLTTLSARKALLKLMEIMDEREINVCWADRELLK